MSNIPTQKTKSLQARMISGSVLLLSGSGLATAVNLVYNIAVARFLGPKGFGDATAVYTLLTLLSAVTLSFQLISAKVVAQQKSQEGKYEGYRGLQSGAWVCGVGAALLLLLFQRSVSNYLNLSDPVLVALLAVGIAFYVPLGGRRGYLQGLYGFRSLATNLVLEGAVRLAGSLLLILMGLDVRGVIAANSVAVAVAYFAIRPKRATGTSNLFRLSRAFQETSLAVAFFSGQVLINNCDIVLVKHFFLPREAGLYAAVAMVGRVIFSLSQAIVNSMFPLVAGAREQERRSLRIIATSLVLVLAIGFVMVVGLRLAPASVWTALFGAKFEIAGEYGLPYLMALYAATAVLYSLSAVIITYEMSYKIANAAWTQLVCSGLVVAGIWRFHSSLRQVILVQLVLMIALLVFVAIPFFIGVLMDMGTERNSAVFQPLRLIRRASEDEVIAEFLKSDFHRAIFQEYRDALREIVLKPNLKDPGENAKRRALFSIRHRTLWNELPAGTEWYELELVQADLDRISVFPRAHWRKIVRGTFSLHKIVDGVRSGQNSLDRQFLTKINAIRDQLTSGDADPGLVVLIGTNEKERLTVLDGNHRLVAAMLASPTQVHRLRFMCGLSPRMMECCWYNTNLSTILRYGRNFVRHAARRPRAELARLLQISG